MDVLRRNTDYAIRSMLYLSECYGKRPVSVKELATERNFSYQLGCKLLQKLRKAGFVKSSMGPKGGYELSRDPAKITLYEIIDLFQNGIRLNKCLLGGEGCEFQSGCQVSLKLVSLQRYIDGYLGGITLAELLNNQQASKEKQKAG